MAVTVKVQEDIPLSYPVARKCTSSDLTVLFTHLNSGIVIVGDASNPVGKYSKNWAQATDYREWGIVEVTING